MAWIEITMTELVWPGKYNEDGRRREVERVCLPLPIIEPTIETGDLGSLDNVGIRLALQDTVTRPGDAQARVRSGAAEV